MQRNVRKCVNLWFYGKSFAVFNQRKVELGKQIVAISTFLSPNSTILETERICGGLFVLTTANWSVDPKLKSLYSKAVQNYPWIQYYYWKAPRFKLPWHISGWTRLHARCCGLLRNLNLDWAHTTRPVTDVKLRLHTHCLCERFSGGQSWRCRSVYLHWTEPR